MRQESRHTRAKNRSTLEAGITTEAGQSITNTGTSPVIYFTCCAGCGQAVSMQSHRIATRAEISQSGARTGYIYPLLQAVTIIDRRDSWATLPPLEDAKFGPNGKVVRHSEGLFGSEIEYPYEIHNTTFAIEFACV